MPQLALWCVMRIQYILIHAHAFAYILFVRSLCEAPLSVDLIASMHGRCGMNETDGMNPRLAEWTRDQPNKRDQQTRLTEKTPSRLQIVTYELVLRTATKVKAELSVASERYAAANKALLWRLVCSPFGTIG